MDETFPACRYCKSQTHTSEEFERCSQSFKEFFEHLAEKKLGDCNISDLLLRLQALCPLGFNFSYSLSDKMESGADINILVFGELGKSLRMSQFVSFFIKDSMTSKSQTPSHHVINPTGGSKSEKE